MASLSLQTQHLTLQATPFCNLRCRYCYLGNKSEKKVISLDTISAAIEGLKEDGLLGPTLTVSWHSGEPLAVGLAFFQNAVPLTNEKARGSFIKHTLQTNGTLINDEFARFFKENDFFVGLSLDGFEELHSKNRVYESGSSSFRNTIRGLRLLQKHQVNFGIICVVTEQTLEHPEVLHDFFANEGIAQVSLNVEEVEGINKHTSLSKFNHRNKYAVFLKRFHQHSLFSGRRIRLREFEIIDSAKRQNRAIASGSVIPFSNISIAVNGDFSTFSPELLTAIHASYGDFVFGNVHKGSYIQAFQSQKFKKVWSEIKAGLLACKDACRYFPVCGGGYPSNKVFENNTFASTETISCVMGTQVPAEVFGGMMPVAPPSC